MKNFLFFLCIVFSFQVIIAQPKIIEKKYPSLLWEISGNGIKKPSYLIGTMHVSSKLAFNLPDSFYIAIRNSQMVALETNPETWQEDMSKYDFNTENTFNSKYRNFSTGPSDYLNINTLKFYKYENKIQRSLYSNPSTINNLLYRSYGNESSDFEEDTYLDMYIFQCGKKWGKKVTGVENYGESMQLMAEAYRDAAKDKNKKRRSYGDMDGDYSIGKLQEAYRSGNLDLLDSINKFNSYSAAFDEKFLYKRNEIQASSMDSIIQAGTVLFAGVGAAHLPGDRGVIEILRSKGYILRPIKMGARASKEKELVEKIRVPVVFRTTAPPDSLFKVDIPGKFYKFGDDIALDQRQFADMANGSFYMVTRIMTNAWMWSQSKDDVYKTLDSLLYENIPGKIISKSVITKNGFRGFDITNRTRRGDLQRYNIFITPFEIVFFKMGGTGDYVKNGEEANRFFGSIQFKEYKNGTTVTNGWKKYTPPYGGFSVMMPHLPYVGNDGSWIYDAEDKANGNYYRIIRTDIHNYNFAEEDSFDLGLMDESFMASEFIDTQLTRIQTTYKGYPALDCKYRDKKNAVYLTRFLIQGPHYYTLVAYGREETAAMKDFLNSFEIKSFLYGPSKLQVDTALYYSVTTPVFPVDNKIKLNIPANSFYGADSDDDETSEDDLLEAGAYRNKIISNDSTGEKIFVSFYRSPRYYYTKDSAALEKDERSFLTDSTWIVREKNKTELPNKTKVWEVVLSDTGSSRTLHSKIYYKDGIGLSINTQSDTLSVPSEFTRNFFETFIPADTLKGVNPFIKKSNLFFEDFKSTDSALHKFAVNHIGSIYLDSTDLPQLKKLISGLSWDEKRYIAVKRSLINKLSNIKTNAAAIYLKELYYALDDTIQLQQPVLENLLQHKTAFAYTIFKDIIKTETPVLDFDSPGYSSYRSRNVLYTVDYKSNDGKFMDELSDTLRLTRTILPSLLPLLNLEDYKPLIMKLLGEMVDSNLVKPDVYALYFEKFLLEAKQEIKKQSIAEKKKTIEKAEANKTGKKNVDYDEDKDEDTGNDDLSLYAKLLIPYWESNAAVQALLNQMLQSNDKRLKYNTMLLMLDKNKPYPDSLLTYFAEMDEYRFELYTDLKFRGKLEKFPARFNNHLALGKSALLDKASYSIPDTVVYVDRLKATYLGKNGFIYFYKYKNKKDDLTWKLATVGLLPENPDKFEFEETDQNKQQKNLWQSYRFDRYDFTGFTASKIKDDVAIEVFLKKELKKMLYSKRKSAKEFYGEGNPADMDYDD